MMRKDLASLESWKAVTLVFNIVSNLPHISAYYCDHNLCENDQYCCGDNLCCEYVYSIWYFWVGVAFFILVLSACGGFFRYCYSQNSYIIMRTGDFYPSLNMNEEKILTSVITDVEGTSLCSSGMQQGYKKFSCAYEQSENNSNIRTACN